MTLLVRFVFGKCEAVFFGMTVGWEPRAAALELIEESLLESLL